MKPAHLLLAAGLATALRVAAQSALDPERIDAARNAFETAIGAPGLRCEMRPVHPVLDYSLRFQTGYVVDFPLKQLAGTGHHLDVLARVTPEKGQPVYLGHEDSLPEVPAVKEEGEFTGNFLVGEGTYLVEVLMRDEALKACYSKWNIEAKRSGVERDLQPAMPPGAVEELGLPVGGESPTPTGRRIGRLTILLHATARNPQAAKVEEETVRTLQDSLAALVYQLPANAVRLVMFNLDKQVVLLRKENFTARDLEQVGTAINTLELALVDVKTLANRDKVDVLNDLIYKETRATDPANAVIVMGPRTFSKVDPATGSDVTGTVAPWFYLQFQTLRGPVARRMFPRGDSVTGMDESDASRAGPAPHRRLGGFPPPPPPSPDGIEQLIHRLEGQTFAVASPREYADALHRMAAAISSRLPAVQPAAPPPPAERVQPPPATPATGEDPVAVLMRLRDQVLAHAAKVPNHTCVEDIQRDRYEPAAGHSTRSCDTILARRKQSTRLLKLETTDWLRLDVGLAEKGEIYSWAGAPQFAEEELDQLVPQGAIGTGPFAAMLLGIFEERHPEFGFAGDSTLDGRRLLEYTFTVPKERSQYRVRTAQHAWIVVGYSGTFWVDPRNAELVRLSVRTDELPESTGACEVDSTFEYGMVPIGGLDYLLPKSSRQRWIARNGAEGENTIAFTACREYRGESSITFEGKAPSNAGAPENSSAPRPLRGGLPLIVDLAAPIVFEGAAAGDRIEGRLARPLRDAERQVTIAPAGARVEGHLMRVEFRHAGAGQYEIALRWETLELDGAKVPLALRATRRATEIALPLKGEEHYGVYRFPGQQRKIQDGFRTEWETEEH